MYRSSPESDTCASRSHRIGPCQTGSNWDHFRDRTGSRLTNYAVLSPLDVLAHRRSPKARPRPAQCRRLAASHRHQHRLQTPPPPRPRPTRLPARLAAPRRPDGHHRPRARQCDPAAPRSLSAQQKLESPASRIGQKGMAASRLGFSEPNPAEQDSAPSISHPWQSHRHSVSILLGLRHLYQRQN